MERMSTTIPSSGSIPRTTPEPPPKGTTGVFRRLAHSRMSVTSWVDRGARYRERAPSAWLPALRDERGRGPIHRVIAEVIGVVANQTRGGEIFQRATSRHVRSMMVAIPCPTPMHIVASP